MVILFITGSYIYHTVSFLLLDSILISGFPENCQSWRIEVAALSDAFTFILISKYLGLTLYRQGALYRPVEGEGNERSNKTHKIFS